MSITDKFAGTCGAVMIGVGIVGAGITGIVADRTKRFEEVAKTFFALAVVAAAGFIIVSNFFMCLFMNCITVSKWGSNASSVSKVRMCMS